MTEKVEKLTPKCFLISPIWTWSDDKEGHLPLLDVQCISKSCETLFIKAELITNDGKKFEGYIVGRTSFYALFVFHGGVQYPISLTSLQARNIGLKNLWNGLGFELERFFPVTYNTKLFYDSGERITGVLFPK